MANFIAILDRDDQLNAVKKLLEEHYPDDYYQYHSNPNIFLIESKSITEQIAHKIGMKNDDYPDISGAVFKLHGAYSGFTAGTVWEWLSRNE